MSITAVFHVIRLAKLQGKVKVKGCALGPVAKAASAKGWV
jgi:hypothetical protein